jgi:hypothetical protein
MKNNFKIFFVLVVLVTIFGGFLLPLVNVSAATDTTSYKLLAPLPCPPGADCPAEGLKTYEFGKGNSEIGKYLNLMISLFIGICAVLAVIMIVAGGLEYMGSELITSKEHGKDRIKNAILGLLLALGAYIILHTINPQLLDTKFESLDEVEVYVTLEPETGIQGNTTTANGQSVGACDESQITTMTLFGHRVQINKAVVEELKRVDEAWNRMPVNTRYKVNSIGGYNCRKVAGKPNHWSEHAFGLALDINPSTNPYSREFKSDMPAEFINLFTSTAGWVWGGSWINVKDPMHFSKTGK